MTCQESIAIVKSGQNKRQNKELCCMFISSYKAHIVHDRILHP